MPSTCCAFNCKNRGKKGSGITFYRFPFARKDLFEKWLAAIRRDNFTPTDTTRICSVHFTKDCFRELNDQRRLTVTAVPTIFDFSTSGAKVPPVPRESNRYELRPTTNAVSSTTDFPSHSDGISFGRRKVLRPETPPVPPNSDSPSQLVNKSPDRAKVPIGPNKKSVSRRKVLRPRKLIRFPSTSDTPSPSGDKSLGRGKVSRPESHPTKSTVPASSDLVQSPAQTENRPDSESVQLVPSQSDNTNGAAETSVALYADHSYTFSVPKKDRVLLQNEIRIAKLKKMLKTSRQKCRRANAKIVMLSQMVTNLRKKLAHLDETTRPNNAGQFVLAPHTELAPLILLSPLPELAPQPVRCINSLYEEF